MAGADAGQQLSPLRDATRWAASFLRMARLFTGAAPAQLLAEEEEEVFSGGSCNARYEGVSTEEEEEEGDDGSDGDTARGSAFGVDAGESAEEQLLAGVGEDRSARTVSDQHSRSCGVHTTNKAHEFMRRPAAARAAWRSGDAAVEESEPLVLRRAARRANDAETLDHPFGCDRRGRVSSSLLLISS